MLSLFQVLAPAVLALIAMFVAPAAAAWRGREALQAGFAADKQLLQRYWALILRGWLVAGFIVLVWKADGRPLSQLGLNIPPTWPNYVGFAAIGAFLALLPMQLWHLSRVTRPELGEAMRQIEAIKITPDTWRELAVFMLVSVTAGVWEELLYRGFLLWYLAPHVGIVGAVVASSLLFGLGHAYQGPSGVAQTTVLGIVFSLFYLSSGTLWWVMALHAAIDVQAGFVSFRIKRIAVRRRGRADDIAAKMRQRGPF